MTVLRIPESSRSERGSGVLGVGRILAFSAALLTLGVCGGTAQQPQSQLVLSSDATLAELASALLPDLAARAGLELRAPVRLEMRTRA